MTRLFLFVLSVIFFAFGGLSLVDPISMAENLGVEIGGRHGVYEMRGIYGGVSFGAAILCLSGALKSSMARPALYFLLAYMGGYVFARAAGIYFDGVPEPYFWTFIGFETVTALISLALLRKNAGQ